MVLSDIEKFIIKHIRLEGRRPDLVEAADYFLMTKSKFKYSTRRIGVRYSDLCNQVSINLTLSYLHNTTLTCDDICKKVGYSKSQLYRLWKTHFGMTLEQYRDHIRLKKIEDMCAR